MVLNCNHIFVLFIIITYLKYTTQTIFDDDEDDQTIELPDKVNTGHYLVKDEDADMSNEPSETLKDKLTEKEDNSDETKEGNFGKLEYII